VLPAHCWWSQGLLLLLRLLLSWLLWRKGAVGGDDLSPACSNIQHMQELEYGHGAVSNCCFSWSCCCCKSVATFFWSRRLLAAFEAVRIVPHVVCTQLCAGARMEAG
jgi:hypothetical protein